MARTKGSRRRGVAARKKRRPAAKNHRSAITGRYVTAKYGRSHPRTTVAERRKR
ncbi:MULTISPECIES: hypothetical protein [unclassified Modestobacter]